MTVNQILGWVREKVTWPENCDLEPRILLGYVLGKDLAWLIAYEDSSVSSRQFDAFRDLLEKRENGIPIAYLTGTREFWSLPIAVNNQVLIPRHETETLVERVLALAGKTPEASILELGTGSGAIAFALASELPHAHITATDVSIPALELAGYNQRQLELKNIRFMESDWFGELDGSVFDLICSNPPYISPDDVHLQQGDVRFEPNIALVADRIGYGAIDQIVANAISYLIPGGWIVIEHGYQQGEGVRRRLSEAGYLDISTYQDLGGIDRVTQAKNKQVENSAI